MFEDRVRGCGCGVVVGGEDGGAVGCGTVGGEVK